MGSGEGDLDASTDAFAVLDTVVAARVRRGLNTVIDTLGLDAGRRSAAVALGRGAGLPVVAVRFSTALDVCRTRNRLRDRPVPAPALKAQFQRAAAVDLAADGFDLVIVVDGGVDEQVRDSHRISSRRPPQDRRSTSDGPAARPALRLADLVIPLGPGPTPLVAGGGPVGRADRVRGHRRDGPPAADPAGGPRLGPDPGGVRDPGLSGRRHRTRRPRRAGHPGHLPVRSAAGEDPGQPGRGVRWPGVLRSRGRLVRAGTPDLRAAVSGRQAATRCARIHHRGAPGLLGTGHETVCGTAGVDLLSASGRDPDHRGRRRRAAHPGHRRPARRRVQRRLGVAGAGPQAGDFPGSCGTGRAQPRRPARHRARPADRRRHPGRGGPARRGAPWAHLGEGLCRRAPRWNGRPAHRSIPPTRGARRAHRLRQCPDLAGPAQIERFAPIIAALRT